MRHPFRRQPAPAEPAPPSAPLAPEHEAALRAQARLMIRPGFLERSDAYYALSDWYAGQGVATAPLEAAVRRIVDQEWATREAELADGDQGDYGRLVAAFEALAGEGVLARMDFACCQNCGTTEIDDERTADEWAYTFFHQQDTERLADGAPSLYLTYSAFAGTVPDEEVGRTVQAALEQHGLAVTWGGSGEERILVAVPRWRKPLPQQ